MQGPRVVLLALAVGLGAGGYAFFWFHWAALISAAAGILAGTVILVTSASVSRDPGEADAAWWAAAADLVEPVAGPRPDRGTTKDEGIERPPGPGAFVG